MQVFKKNFQTQNAKDTFKYVLQEINSYVDMIEKSRTNLDEKVKQRTTELEKAYRKLQSTQEQLIQSEKLAAMGQLVSAMVHEIKNPLAETSGAIDVIADEVSFDDPKKEIFSEIKVQIERIRKTLTDLLMFARPSQPERKPTNLNTLITETLHLVQQQKGTERITFEKVLSPSLPDLNLDPDQIQQVFLNIFLNAIQAMSEGGTLTTRIYIGDDSEYCVVEISDTGIGISSEQLSHIFEPFYTSKHKGTGLGLSIAKRISEEHGGKISVSSKSGKGTLFRILLPIQQRVVTVGHTKNYNL